ncbi:cytochrome P450 4c21-like isoform X2 [Daktulosphaira vitifoliae]|nr:cytochrome P450 4c21-like isoform X2 [Daktulosphaira vitifoliae]
MVILFKNKNDRRTYLAKQISGLNGLSYVGILPLLFQGPETILTLTLQLFRRFGKSTFKIWILDNLYIFPTKPEDIEIILNNTMLFKKSNDYLVLKESIMSQGIFSSEKYHKWKTNRKMVATGFNFSIIKSFIPIFYEEAMILGNILYKRRNFYTHECEVSKSVSMATMEMIGRTAFGVKFNAQHNSNHEFVSHFKIIQKAWAYRILHPWFLNKTLFKMSSVKQKHDKSQRIIFDFIDNLLKKKQAEMNEKKNNYDLENVNDCKKTKTLIEILLENENMKHTQIRQEAITVIIGGQDTTAFTNSCILFMLAHHQDVQDNVFEEISTIFSSGDPDRIPTYEDLQQMKYLECVIKETLRLYPPLPFMCKNVQQEFKLGNHLIPADSTLTIFIPGIHLNPKYYDKPRSFNPDNFLPDVYRQRHPCTFIPFSAGYRNCIGVKYAMTQMKTVISTLVRFYHFSPSARYPSSKSLRLEFLGSLKFINGCYINIRFRT